MHRITEVRRDDNGVTTMIKSSAGIESVATAIAAIEGRWRSYYTVYAGQRAEVIVAKTAGGTKYLKSTPDGTTRNNLDYLDTF